MNATAVQTSAHDAEPDMFGMDLAHGVDLSAGAIVLQGVLVQDAEVRTQLVGLDSHPRPVLWLEIRPASRLHRTVHAEQIYTEATRKEAERIAATLKRGARVTVTTPLADMRTIFPHVQAVALLPSTR